ncbi:MAG: ECF-type sigma factor [Planctomycetaceae bacterium]
MHRDAQSKTDPGTQPNARPAAETEQMLASVYQQLRQLAARELSKERPGQTWQATEVAHEAYLRLSSGSGKRSWTDQRHFLSAAAVAIRHTLVDRARARMTEKRGGKLRRADALPDVPAPDEQELISLDEALAELAQQRPDAAELVHLRYFAGLTLTEAASVMGLSPRTAGRTWAYAQAFLKVALSNEESER